MENLWQFYLLIIVIFMQGVLLYKRIPVLFIFLTFLELFFIAGFRAWHIGNDTISYIQIFILTTDYPNLITSHMESGYLLFNKFLALFTSNAQYLLISTAFFITGAWLFTMYKYSKNILLSVLLFVISEYGATLTMIRQEIAVCIVMLSTVFIIKRKFIPFLVCCFFAMSFHSTAILAIGLYFIYPLKFNMKYLIFVLLGTFFVFIFLAPIINQIIFLTGRYSSYVGNILLGEETKLASIMKTLIQFSITCFCFLSYQYVYLKKKGNYPMRAQFMLWCSIIAFCLQFISIRATVMERLVLYYSFVNFISIPFFVSYYPKRTQIFISVSIICCFILYKSIVFVYRPEWNYVLPFEFCF